MSDSLVRVQDGPNGVPAGRCQERADARRHAVTARAANHDRGDGVSTGISTARAWPPLQSAQVHAPSRSADRLSPFHIRPGRIAGPHPLPSRQFQALFDSLFESPFHLSLAVLVCYRSLARISLGRNLPPYWGCIPKQPDSPTAPRGATGSGHDGALTLSGAPSRGLGPGPPLRTLLRLQFGRRGRPILKLGCSRAVVRRRVRVTWSPERRGPHDVIRGMLRPPLVVTSAAGDSILGQPRPGAREAIVRTPRRSRPCGKRGGGATRCVTPRQTCPRPNGFGRNLRSKTRWFTGFCNSHQVSHFATFFIDARAEISVAESRLCF
ncbi:hypothetical protein LguiA_036193 [Lonicera macranthoides]